MSSLFLFIPFLFFIVHLSLSSSSSPSSTSNLTTEEQAQLSHFIQYLQIPTPHPNPDYSPAVSFLSSLAHSVAGDLQIRVLDFSESKTKPLLLVTWPGSDPTLPSILLNSHLDSVPPGDPTSWLHPPFSATYLHSQIFARGAQDDKSISIQHLEALHNLRLRSFHPLRSVHLSFVPDEEIGGLDGNAKFVVSDEFKELNVGFVLDEGQASETGEFRVFYGDKMPWSLVVRAEGEPRHGARMGEGSAVENLMECVERVMRFRDTQFEMVKGGVRDAWGVVSINLVYLKAGTVSPTGFVMNMQPSEAEAGFDVRLPPTEDPDLLRRKIEEEWAPATRNMTYQLIRKGPIRDNTGRPLVTATDESNPWWSVFKEAVMASGGKLQKPEILTSTTDARFMRQMGIPTFGFSPMANTPILLHNHNECLNDTVFLRGIKVYEHVISALSSFPGVAQSEAASV